MRLKRKITWIENWIPAKVRGLDTPCWDCTSHKACPDTGYAKIHQHGNFIGVHRFLYKELFGEIPTKIYVRHKCDNRVCINPEHLEPGSHLDNISDMYSRGRAALGEKNGRSKLKNDEVKAIKKLLKDGLSLKKIAAKFNVHFITISDIKRGVSWKHIII